MGKEKRRTEPDAQPVLDRVRLPAEKADTVRVLLDAVSRAKAQAWGELMRQGAAIDQAIVAPRVDDYRRYVVQLGRELGIPQDGSFDFDGDSLEFRRRERR